MRKQKIDNLKLNYITLYRLKYPKIKVAIWSLYIFNYIPLYILFIGGQYLTSALPLYRDYPTFIGEVLSLTTSFYGLIIQNLQKDLFHQLHHLQ